MYPLRMVRVLLLLMQKLPDGNTRYYAQWFEYSLTGSLQSLERIAFFRHDNQPC